MAKKRRTRSPHPGIVLIAPDPEHGHPTWRARYTDPDTGRTKKERLDPLALRTAEARRQWAIRKAKALAKRKLELDEGAPRATGLGLSEAIDRYFKAHTRLREKTLRRYRDASNLLLTWAEANGVRSADDLTRARLLEFRATLVDEPKRAAEREGKRGTFKPTEAKRSPFTVNGQLGAVRTVLGYLADLDLLPRIHEGDLRRALKKLWTGSARTEYLKPGDLRKLLEACLRHDAETFTATREEHAGRAAPGSTPKYKPIAPFVAFAVLTGARLGEIVDLQWSEVDLSGEGEVYIARDTRTKKARAVGLEHSPALRRLLAALKVRTGGEGSVFGLTYDEAVAAGKRLVREFAAPPRSNWQTLRKTAGSYLTCAPGIFGAASAYRSAKMLGHSVTVAEKHYVGVVRGIPPSAKTLERAMQITAQVDRVIAAVGAGPARGRVVALAK